MPTLAEEMLMRQKAEEEQELADAEYNKQMAEFPVASIPSPTDYK